MGTDLVSRADLLPLLTINNLPVELVAWNLHVWLHLLDGYVQVVFYVSQVLKQRHVKIEVP